MVVHRRGCHRGCQPATAGRSERVNRRKPGIDHRLLWIDSQERHHPVAAVNMAGLVVTLVI